MEWTLRDSAVEIIVAGESAKPCGVHGDNITTAVDQGVGSVGLLGAIR